MIINLHLNDNPGSNGVFVYRAMIDVGVPTGKYSNTRPVNIGNYFVAVDPHLAFTLACTRFDLAIRLHCVRNYCSLGYCDQGIHRAR